MLRRLILLPFLLLLSPLLAAQNLEIWFIDVGQGDATLMRSPTGQTLLMDAGNNGDGWSDVVPLLNSLGIGDLDVVVASHYHADHLGGLDEVWDSGHQAVIAYDRGFNNLPGTASYSSYANRYAGVRTQIQPGQVIDLGGGVTLTCLAVEGDLMGGGSVNISGSSQWENSASIALRLDYGDFQMYIGGDLTGGGNGTTNVESSVGPLCGDVDVYQANHHGSRTSSNAAFVNALSPEFVVVPCGSSNVYGYPKQEVLDRLNKSTWTIPVWCPTDGVGTEGFVDAGGDIHLETDGDTYTITAPDGTSFTAHVDEQAPAAPSPGDLVVAEVMRDPTRVSDSEGEWFEIAGADVNQAQSLAGIKVEDDGADSFTIQVGILLDAGDEVVLAVDGLPGRNGGIRPAIAWPPNRLFLSNSSDALVLKDASLEIDRMNYTSSWPGASGKSAEREDLLASATQSNFSDAVSTYGLGDLGTPGETNDADTTNFGGGSGVRVEVVTQPVVGQLMEMDWYAPGEKGWLFQGWVSLGTSPGITINGTHIPANLDAAYHATSGLSGWSGVVPTTEVMSVSTTVPTGGNLAGTTIYGIFATYADVAGQGIQIREVAAPVAMVIQ